MRTDKIDDAALKQAYDLYQFSERGFHGTGVDADDVPVLAPQVSKLKKEDERKDVVAYLKSLSQ